MLDRLLAPPTFPLAEAHAGSVTTLGLALFYAPILPLSPYIALVALLLWVVFPAWRAADEAAAREADARLRQVRADHDSAASGLDGLRALAAARARESEG